MSKALKYHQKVFDLLQEKPIFSQESRDAVDALQKYLDIDLPDSVIEWFSLEKAPERLAFNGDYVLPIDVIRRIISDSNKKGIPTPLITKVTPTSTAYTTWSRLDKYHPEENLLEFIVETQGVCSWAVDLNGEDDPPVLMQWNEPNANWMLSSKTFSEFVLSRVWDTLIRFSQYSLSSFPKPFSDTDLGYLKEHYGEAFSNRPYPGYTTCLRFGQSDQLISVYPINDKYCECYIYAESLPKLEAFLRDIWHVSDLTGTLNHYDRTSEVSVLLEKLRSEQ